MELAPEFVPLGIRLCSRIIWREIPGVRGTHLQESWIDCFLFELRGLLVGFSLKGEHILL